MLKVKWGDNFLAVALKNTSFQNFRKYLQKQARRSNVDGVQEIFGSFLYRYYLEHQRAAGSTSFKISEQLHCQCIE